MRAPDPRRLLAALLLLVGAFSVGLAASRCAGPLPLPWNSAAAGTPGDVLAPSDPTRIAIPALDVDARVFPVGLDPQGRIAAPPLHRADQAGWYRRGPAPGQHGAAVIVGHVDDAHGPAVFHDVSRLRAGERIEVARRDGQVARFEVTGVRSYPKNRLPADEVYGGFEEPALRLFTCGGPWLGGETGYADSVVVFARLVDG